MTHTHNNSNDDDITQHGGHTLANKLTKTSNLGLQCTSLILDTHVIVSSHLSKQGIN